MTMILTAATPYYLIHMSDRLVTRSDRSGRAHDAASNKTVIYRAKDALVVVGYAGLAYLESMPTDEWVAQQLWGAALPRGPGGRPVMASGAAPVLRDIGQSIETLRRSVERLSDRGIDRYGLELIIAGWQAAGRTRSRPIVVEITRRSGETRVERAERRWSKGQNFRLYGTGMRPDIKAFRRALEPFRGADRVAIGAADVEDALARLIRDAAKRAPAVGSHLLSVILPRPDLAHGVCRFLPLVPHMVVLAGEGRRFEAPVAHGPWMIGAGAIYAPGMEIGTSYRDLGGLEIEMQGAPAVGGLLGMSRAIPRPPPPR